ncbi:MAG TPA: biotin--[acetyl-CoA-carboxylase] ligase [Polyangiaceae bacterium]|jgi:BirA family biotin operon repressor/biotin-[acetyl-CoA-carboxylase] ligase|nr:biotin--[acetyl-CoA-carboxylase] ligase [Polyangiaceae bacterium]
MMIASFAAFDSPRFDRLRRDRGVRFGQPLTVLPTTGSTNDDAFEAAKNGAAEGALFVAEEQTAGRGRRGRSWTSPAGENLTFSLLLRPELPADRVSAVSLLVGLAVRAAAARRVPESVGLKWPNDVVVGPRKLAGILVESRVTGARVDAVVVGVGLNVHFRELPDELRGIATSLAALGDPLPDREAALADVLAELEPRLSVFIDRGLAGLLPELRAHDALAGVPIGVSGIRGEGAGIDGDGSLLIKDGHGEIQRVSSGTVERL